MSRRRRRRRRRRSAAQNTMRSFTKRRRRRRGRRRRSPIQARRHATLGLIFKVKRDRRYSPSREQRRQLVKWFQGRDWSRKIRKLTDRQIRQAVDLNGEWSMGRLSWAAREALGWTYNRNNLTGKGIIQAPQRPYGAAAKVQRQKFEMRAATRNIFNKKTFGTNRLRLLQRTAFKNSNLQYLRDQYPDLADARPGAFGDKSARTLMAEARGGKGIRGRRTKKMVGEHGSWQTERSDGGEFVTLDGKSFRGTYHIFKDGVIMTGANPSQSSRWNQVLIPEDQYEENMEMYSLIHEKARHIERRSGRVKSAGSDEYKRIRRGRRRRRRRGLRRRRR